MGAPLRPDELILIVNKNEPKGKELAEFYAQQRGVPAGRIVELDLPAGDFVTPAEFRDRALVPLRQLLQQQGLKDRVRCMVTFFGVPLRISELTLSPQEKAEFSALTAELQRVQQIMVARVSALEATARKYQPGFNPARTNAQGEELIHRAEAARNALASAVQRVPAGPAREKATAELMQAMRALQQPVPASQPATASSVTGAAKPHELESLVARIESPEARTAARELSRAMGPAAYLQVLKLHEAFLSPEQSDAAFDSELALLWWGAYPRAGWQPNPLRAGAQPGARPGANIVMVSRLDGPTAQRVHELIETSVAVEKTGLSGRAVIDTQGIAEKAPNAGPYGEFDEHLRRLAALLRKKSRLDVVLDEKPEVLPPGSVNNVAIYAGWYSVSKYVPGMQFSRGAVGFHIASFTMGSLHQPFDGDWSRSLLADGCVATMGPVSEPYLFAFPQPDDFFALLLTGKLTLAEAYWRTLPLVSWKMCLVGDPLYAPYRAAPALSVEDLPPRLHPVFSDPAASR